MLSIQYVKSVPRFLVARFSGKRFPSIYTSGYACIRLIETAPLSLPAPDWVRVRPRLAGICGSDLATITAKGSPYFSPFTAASFILGHEVVGEIVGVGSEADPETVGSRVVLEPTLCCLVRGLAPCWHCQKGQTNRCQSTVGGGVLGPGIQTGFCRETGGGWSQEFVAHKSQLHQLPETLSDRQAVLVEPLSCAVKGVLAASMASQDLVVVLGCGTIGLLTIAAVRAFGNKNRLVAIARYPHQEAAARQLGADQVVISDQRLFSTMAGVLDATLHQPELGQPILVGRGAQVVFDCVGSESSIDQSLRFAGPGAQVVLVGMPSIPKGVDWTSIWHKELRVLGSYTSNTSVFIQSLQLLEQNPGIAAGLVGAVFPMRAYREAIRCALFTGRSAVIKTAFQL